MKPINAHLRQVGYTLLAADPQQASLVPEGTPLEVAYRLGERMWEMDSERFWRIVISKDAN